MGMKGNIIKIAILTASFGIKLNYISDLLTKNVVFF